MKKRPFAFAGLTAFAAQTVALFSDIDIKITIFIAAALFAAYMLFVRKNKAFAVLGGIASVIILINAVFCLSSVVPSQRLEGHSAQITGRVVSEAENRNGRYYYVIKTSEIDRAGAPQKLKLRLSAVSSLELGTGDIIKANVTFGIFDRCERYSRFRMLSDGVTAVASISKYTEPQVQRGGFSVGRTVERLRKAIRRTLRRSADGDTAALSCAMLIGDSSELPRSTVLDFRTCGLSHLLAVSGLHMSIISSAVLYILRRARLSYKLSAGLNILAILAYMALTGFSGSVMRAGIMAIISMLAMMLEREPDSLNSLGAAVLIVCTASPFAAGDVGFVLSASCTLGLLTVYPVIYGKIKRRLAGVRGRRRKTVLLRLSAAVLLPAVASLSAFPVTVLVFEETSVIAPLSNLLCVFAGSFLIMLSAVMCIVSLIPFAGSFLARLIGVIALVPSKYLFAVTGRLARIPFASVHTGQAYMPWFVLCAGVIAAAWLVLFSGKKNAGKMAAAGCLMIVALLAAGQTASLIVGQSGSCAVVYDVGDGMGVALYSGSRCVVIGSGGEGWLVTDMLYDIRDRAGSFIDGAYFPSSDMLYSSDAGELLELERPESVFLFSDDSRGEYIRAKAEACGSKVRAESEARFGRISVWCYTDEDNNTWVYAAAEDISVLVCPPGGNCLLIPEGMRSPDIAVVTGGSAANITRLDVTAVVITADSQKSAALSNQLEARGIENVFTTASLGSVRLSAEGAGIRIEGVG